MSIKFWLKVFCIFLAALALFLGIAFVFSREKLLSVDVPEDDVPYIDGKYVPKDCVLLIDLDGKGAVIEILFAKRKINAVLLPSSNPEEAQKQGFYYTHKISCNYSFIREFIDILGGIPYYNIPDYTLTGVQVCNLLASDGSPPDTASKLLSAIFEKISKYGFSSDALYCIIEKTQTDLSSPTCYGWCQILDEVCKNYTVKDVR